MIKNKARWAEPPYALTKKGSVPALCLVHVLFATVVQLGHTLLGFGSWAVRSLKFLSHGRYIGSPAFSRVTGSVGTFQPLLHPMGISFSP